MKENNKKPELYSPAVLKAQRDIEELLAMSPYHPDYNLYFKIFPLQETRTSYKSHKTTAA